LERVEGCRCCEAMGCAACVGNECCKEGNEVLSKAGCTVVLRSFLGLEIDLEALPMGPEEGCPEGVVTVVLAEEVPFRGNKDSAPRVEG